jgi:hypothetical protein
MGSISMIVVDCILAVLAVVCGGIPLVTRPNGAAVNLGYVFLVILALLLFFQAIKVIPTCG